MADGILVDTPVWSLALRRKPEDLSAREKSHADYLRRVVSIGHAHLIGAVRQELLSGLREEPHFERLRKLLRVIENVPTTTEDYEEAARFANVCRRRGVSGSPTDFLLCAVASLRRWEILSLDRDFEQYHRVLGVKLHVI